MKESQNEHFQAWRTPKALFEAVQADYGQFDLDAFADSDNHLCRSYFTEKHSAFNHDWFGRVWANPPYKAGFMAQVVDKAIEEVVYNRCKSVVVLCQASVDTVWFHKALEHAKVELFKGRIQFEREDKAKQKDNSRIANALLIFEDDKRKGLLGTRCAKTGKRLTLFM